MTAEDGPGLKLADGTVVPWRILLDAAGNAFTGADIIKGDQAQNNIPDTARAIVVASVPHMWDADAGAWFPIFGNGSGSQATYPASGLPVLGNDATGADAYAAVLTAPATETHYLHASVGDNGAIISLNGGSTDHFALPANTERLFEGIILAAGASVQAKNLSAGNNFTNLYLSVW